MVRYFANLSLAVLLGFAFNSAFAGGGCQSPTLTVAISPSDTAFVCEGKSIILVGSASGGTPFAWEWSTAETDQNITVTTPGTYWLVAFDGQGCTDTAYVEVVNTPKPELEIGPDQIICNGDSVVLDGGPFDSWSWSTGEVSSSITVFEPMTVALVVTNSFTCQDSDTVTIFRYPVPTVNIGNDTAICSGSTVILDAGAEFVSYDWTTGETSSIIMPDLAGSYSVVVEDTNGCFTSFQCGKPGNQRPPYPYDYRIY